MAAGAGQSVAGESLASEQLSIAATGNASQPDSGDSCRAEVAMVHRATEVLGVGHVAHWMRSRIPSLGNQTPYSLIKTEDGCVQVEQTLLKIEHGVY